jgi:hypothetical protein
MELLIGLLKNPLTRRLVGCGAVALAFAMAIAGAYLAGRAAQHARISEDRDAWRRTAGVYLASAKAWERSFRGSEDNRRRERDQARLAIDDAGKACDARVATARRSAAAIQSIVTKEVRYDESRCPVRAVVGAGDQHFRYSMHVAGASSVDDEFAKCARFLRASARPTCQTVVIPSNHNDAFPRWIREFDGRGDEVNLLLWHEANAAILRAIRDGDTRFDVVRWALARHDGQSLEDILFPPRDASFLICQDQGGIENIYHGDKGPNGARGTPQALINVAMRLNTAHTHVAGILDEIYTAGLSGLMDQGYNTDAPSSWSHTLIATYPNAKRSLITMRGDRYRA